MRTNSSTAAYSALLRNGYCTESFAIPSFNTTDVLFWNGNTPKTAFIAYLLLEAIFMCLGSGIVPLMMEGFTRSTVLIYRANTRYKVDDRINSSASQWPSCAALKRLHLHKHIDWFCCLHGCGYACPSGRPTFSVPSSRYPAIVGPTA